MDVKELIDALNMTRPHYEAEAISHKFLLDAYAGTGGFGGSVRLPESSWWGAAAEIYSQFANQTRADLSTSSEGDLDTYLDRYPREDLEKFKFRVGVAHYPNYVEPILNTVLSHYHRKEPIRSVPSAIEDWMSDVNGSGETWEQMMSDVVTARAAVLGWCPVLGDMDPIPAGVDPETFTAAAAAQHGIRFRALPLLPEHLLDWDTDDNGEFVWVKMRIDRIVREGPFAPALRVSEFTIWTRQTATTYAIGSEVEGTGEPRLLSSPEEKPHPFGTVPIRICKARSIPNDGVKGRPMGFSISVQAKRLFNLLSELDEHIRSNVFAMLQVPSADSETQGELVIGAGNAVFVHPEWKRGFEWLSPGIEASTILETRIEKTISEMYRMAQQEFSRGSKAPASGTAMAFEFEGTNRRIADFAKSVAHFEEEFLSEVAAPAMQPPVPEGQRNDVRITAHQKFNVEELLREIDEAMRLIDVKLGSTATSELKRRLVAKALPNLTKEQLDAVNQELDQLEEDAAQDRAMMLALASGGGEDDDTDEEQNGASDDDEDEAKDTNGG